MSHFKLFIAIVDKSYPLHINDGDVLCGPTGNRTPTSGLQTPHAPVITISP